MSKKIKRLKKKKKKKRNINLTLPCLLEKESNRTLHCLFKIDKVNSDFKIDKVNSNKI